MMEQRDSEGAQEIHSLPWGTIERLSLEVEEEAKEAAGHRRVCRLDE